MARVIIGKLKEEFEYRAILVATERARSETQFCAKCGLSNKLITTQTGTLCGCCNTELTWN